MNKRVAFYFFLLAGLLIYKYTVASSVAIATQITAPVTPHVNELKVGPGAAASRVLPLEELIELDYKTRDQVFQIRTDKVNLHADLLAVSYLPSMKVYGQITDGKPWWGIQGEFCEGPGQESIEGLSEETRFLANPFLLLGLDEGKAFTLRGFPCVPAYPHPLSLTWYAIEAKAEVVYDLSRFFRERSRQPKIFSPYDSFELVNLNARDFGYNFINADPQASFNVVALDKARLFSNAVPLQAFIHTGGSCGYPGGCNNASPYEPDLRVKVTSLPAQLTLRLWKEPPSDFSQPADFTFIMNLN